MRALSLSRTDARRNAHTRARALESLALAHSIGNAAHPTTRLMPHSYLNLNLNLNLNPEPPTCFIGASSHTATQSRGASGLVALLGLLAASLLTVAVLDESVGGTGPDNLFSWHPVNPEP